VTRRNIWNNTHVNYFFNGTLLKMEKHSEKEESAKKEFTLSLQSLLKKLPSCHLS